MPAAALLARFAPASIELSRASLDFTGTRPFTAAELRSAGRAAVLVGLFAHPADDTLHVLLTLRSAALSAHTGEVALPGGKRDPEDNGSDETTALREANEEIGIIAADSAVLGPLDYMLSKFGMVVRPIVAHVRAPNFVAADGFAVCPSIGEVASVFSVPLEAFLAAAHHRHEDRQYRGQRFRLHFFELTTCDYCDTEGRCAAPDELRPPRIFTVWGLSAAICINAAQIAYQRKPDFPIGPTTTIRDTCADSDTGTATSSQANL